MQELRDLTVFKEVRFCIESVSHFEGNVDV